MECIREVTLSTGTIGTLLFADDMVIVAETPEALLHNVEVMNAALTDQMGSKGKLEEVESDESGEKGRGVLGND